MHSFSNLWELFQAGGWVMWPLLGYSLLTWAVVFERGVFYWKINQRLKTFHLEVMRYLEKGDFYKLIQFFEKEKLFPLGMIYQEVFSDEVLKNQNTPIDFEKYRKKIFLKRTQNRENEKKHLWMLATMGSTAPFLGLFGTVVGILSAFHKMALEGKGGFVVVASGISEALVATATGIIVAVVAMVAYNVLGQMWKRVFFKIDLFIEEFWMSFCEKLKKE